MERAGNGASGKRCDMDGMTRTSELAGVSESSRDMAGKAVMASGQANGLTRFRRNLSA